MSKTSNGIHKVLKNFEKTFKAPNNSPKILLVGYNGANNTGSEAKLLSIIEDVRSVLGPDVHITIPTLNEENLRRYLKEDEWLKIVPMSSIFFFDIRRLVKEHDMVLLVEGSCYMDTWTSALLWAFLWTTRCANSSKKPCIAYAVDAGDLSPFNRYLVKREASKTDLILTRTELTAGKLKEIGVKAPIEVTADNAFTFKPLKKDENILKESWPEIDSGVIGLAAVDFNLWPVVTRLWGKKENLYKWPYYYSRSKERIQESEKLALKWAKFADRIIEKYGKRIALICMEELDEPLAKNIKNKMKNPERAHIFSSKYYNASQMTYILRSLDLLVTSRCHAAVLSLEAQIPQIAIGHDTRLRGLYHELGLEDYFIPHNSEKIWGILEEKVDKLFEKPEVQKKLLRNGFIDHLNRASKNPKILENFLQKRGWNVRT